MSFFLKKKLTIDFRFVRAHSINQAVLNENPFIIGWRKKYVKRIQEYKKNGRNIFYFDESYIHQHHAPNWILHDTTIKSAQDASARGLTTGLFFEPKFEFLGGF